MHTLLFSSFFPHYQFWVVIDVWRRENFPIHTQRVEIVYEYIYLFFYKCVLKFGFSEEATKFEKIFVLLLTQKVDEDFSKQMWSSCIIQTLKILFVLHFYEYLKTVAFITGKKNPATQKFFILFSIEIKLPKVR